MISDDETLSQELIDTAHREAMLRRAANEILAEAERLRERSKRIRAAVRRLRGGEASGPAAPDSAGNRAAI
jgi:hypothetical protein